MPLKARSTVTSRPLAALRVAVTVAEPAASARGLPLRLSVTVGGASSSVIEAVTCCVPDSSPFVTPLMSTMIVSVFSSSVSWAAVRLTLPELEPAEMMIWVPLRV